MSCFFSAFPSVWIYTVSPGVLLCSLAERMNGLPPPLPLIWLFEGCGCHWALQPSHTGGSGSPLDHHWDFWSIQPSALVRLGEGTEMCSSQHCLEVFLGAPGVCSHLYHCTQPQVAAFPFALRIQALCWFCRLGQWVEEELFLSSYPSYSVINPWGEHCWDSPSPLLKADKSIHKHTTCVVQNVYSILSKVYSL